MAGKVARIVELEIFDKYYATLVHIGDTKKTNNPIDNVMCQDINVI